jgi:hypothetical protein
MRAIIRMSNFITLISDKDGEYGAACHGIGKFPYSVRDSLDGTRTRIIEILCSGRDQLDSDGMVDL